MYFERNLTAFFSKIINYIASSFTLLVILYTVVFTYGYGGSTIELSFDGICNIRVVYNVLTPKMI